MILVLLGPPGVGKGTQARRICKEFGIVHLSTGELLREAIRAGTPLGQQVAETIARGELVPDKAVVDLVTEHLAQLPGCLLDGFPRTVPQAEALQEWIDANGRRLDLVIELQVDRQEIQRRLVERAKIEGRTDDTPEAIAQRLKVYDRQTRPLVDFYQARGQLAVVSGTGGPEEVFERIRRLIQRIVKK